MESEVFGTYRVRRLCPLPESAETGLVSAFSRKLPVGHHRLQDLPLRIPCTERHPPGPWDYPDNHPWRRWGRWRALGAILIRRERTAGARGWFANLHQRARFCERLRQGEGRLHIEARPNCTLLAVGPASNVEPLRGVKIETRAWCRIVDWQRLSEP
jgi:hypothetical protein